MTNEIKSDHALDQYAASIAEDIIEEWQRQNDGETLEGSSEVFDAIHEAAEGSEHVIYYYKAHAICQNCNTCEGEAFLEEVGNPEHVTYDSLAVAIAYGELRARIETALNEIIEESE